MKTFDEMVLEGISRLRDGGPLKAAVFIGICPHGRATGFLAFEGEGGDEAPSLVTKILDLVKENNLAHE